MCKLAPPSDARRPKEPARERERVIPIPQLDPDSPLTRSHDRGWLEQVLVLDGEVVQWLVLQHRQVDRNIRAGLGAELEVYGIHSHGIHPEGLLVRHIARAHRVASRVATLLLLLLEL